ncbi:hypothetical protein BHX94_09105 [Macrococcoides bohemicum]|uniref:Uncharacterized protein n=1 Tax=Macrococcoides bohemicum TaxID=1903056 RepID=A0A328A5P9_9STAP|nr:hypothetical protein [Macrococcus bohemicus]RAK48798.1 hypothetical protein BHX94_09105 [Macrococcus bohemicus]
MHLNNKIGYKDINITMQNAKGMDANDLAIIMEDYHAKYDNSINYEASELKHQKTYPIYILMFERMHYDKYVTK